MKLEVSSTFYLRIIFSGYYDRGCGMTFALLDKKHEKIYSVDLRCNNKDRYRFISLNKKHNGKWGQGARSDMPDLKRENDIYVTVTDTHYQLSINNIEIIPKVVSDLWRLPTFKEIRLWVYGNCLFLDRSRSYMSNEGMSGHFFFAHLK